MENCIPCHGIEDAQHAKRSKKGFLESILNWLNKHSIEGAEFMGKTK